MCLKKWLVAIPAAYIVYELYKRKKDGKNLRTGKDKVDVADDMEKKD